MSSDPNPYQATQDPRQQVRKSGWVVTYGVVCIILGILGTLNAVPTLFCMSLSLFGVNAMDLNPATNDPALAPQMEFSKELNSVNEKYALAHIVVALVDLPISVLLIVGGFKTMGRKMSGRNILLFTVAICVVLALGNGVLAGMISSHQFETIDNYEGELPVGPGPDLRSMTKFIAIGTLVWMLFISTICVIFYVSCFIYLLSNPGQFTEGGKDDRDASRPPSPASNPSTPLGE